MSRTLLFFKIVAASILLAIVYGLIQDQITIRICPEYFTIFHPNPLQIEDITLLALFWGVAATWWYGLFLGLIVGFAACLGPFPLLPFKAVLRLLVGLMVAVGLCTLVAGLVASRFGFTALDVAGPDIAAMGPEKLHAFSVDFAAHNMSYFAAAIGAMVVAFMVVRRRARAGDV